jgi:hypothetical protein
MAQVAVAVAETARQVAVVVVAVAKAQSLVSGLTTFTVSRQMLTLVSFAP